MKTKFFNRVNMLIASLLATLGFSSCEPQVKYGPAPDVIEKYGVPYAEEVEEADSDSDSIVVEPSAENE